MIVIRGLILLAFVLLAYSAPTKSIKAGFQDIEGGAKRIFGERPTNPAIARLTEKRGSTAQPSSKTVPNDAVEDALILGNSARDANPPRYEDAETAYRLAAKLDANDARPYIGLGNIMYDQQRYIEAAKMYRQGLSLLAAAANRGGRKARVRSIQPGPDELARIQGEYHAFLGTCLLLENQLSAAEKEFQEAISYSSKQGKWYALLGYTFYLQKRFEDASAHFRTAILLDPKNSTYPEMLKAVTKQGTRHRQM